MVAGCHGYGQSAVRKCLLCGNNEGGCAPLHCCGRRSRLKEGVAMAAMLTLRNLGVHCGVALSAWDASVARRPN